MRYTSDLREEDLASALAPGGCSMGRVVHIVEPPNATLVAVGAPDAYGGEGAVAMYLVQGSSVGRLCLLRAPKGSTGFGGAIHSRVDGQAVLLLVSVASGQYVAAVHRVSPDSFGVWGCGSTSTPVARPAGVAVGAPSSVLFTKDGFLVGLPHADGTNDTSGAAMYITHCAPDHVKVPLTGDLRLHGRAFTCEPCTSGLRSEGGDESRALIAKGLSAPLVAKLASVFTCLLDSFKNSTRLPETGCSYARDTATP